MRPADPFPVPPPSQPCSRRKCSRLIRIIYKIMGHCLRGDSCCLWDWGFMLLPALPPRHPAPGIPLAGAARSARELEAPLPAWAGRTVPSLSPLRAGRAGPGLAAGSSGPGPRPALRPPGSSLSFKHLLCAGPARSADRAGFSRCAAQPLTARALSSLRIVPRRKESRLHPTAVRLSVRPSVWPASVDGNHAPLLGSAKSCAGRGLSQEFPCPGRTRWKRRPQRTLDPCEQPPRR